MGRILGYSVLTFVTSAEFPDGESVVVHRAVEGGHERVRAPLPALLSVVKEINVPRLCTLKGKMDAKKADLSLLGAEDIPLVGEYLGLAGSPTKVVRVSYPQITRSGKKISAAEDLPGALDEILALLGPERGNKNGRG